MDADIVAFVRDRLADDEAAAKEPLCINCKIPIVPLRNAFGITGYTHDSWDGGEHGWQGQRCPGALTGAEAVQNPARVLAEVEAKRRIVASYESAAIAHGAAARGTEVHDLMTGSVNSLRYVLRLLAAPYAQHPDYREEWKP